jgi:hypothetical protein
MKSRSLFFIASAVSGLGTGLGISMAITGHMTAAVVALSVAVFAVWLRTNLLFGAVIEYLGQRDG